MDSLARLRRKVGFDTPETLLLDCLHSLYSFGGMGVTLIGCTAIVFKVLLFVSFLLYQLHW
jgi:hypothetical protein